MSPVADVSLSRRTALRLGAGGVAAAMAARGLSLVAAQDATPAAAQPAPATFVLVHGAWAGAWIWRDIIRLLRAAGHEVHASTATGMGDRAHLADPGIDLDVYITDVVNLLEYEDLTDVTLVGWSFGGLTITGVAEKVPERLAQLVYIDAFVPEDGQNNYDVLTPSEEDRKAILAADVAAANAAGTPGFVPFGPGVEEWIRGAVKDPAVADWFLSKLEPHPLGTWTQPVQLGNLAAAALPRAIILCTADKDPQTDPYVLTVERVRSDPNWRVIELADNHMVNLNDPEATAEALLSLV